MEPAAAPNTEAGPDPETTAEIKQLVGRELLRVGLGHRWRQPTGWRYKDQKETQSPDGIEQRHRTCDRIIICCGLNIQRHKRGRDHSAVKPQI